MTERRIAERYQLHEVLGRGGMGTVWRATDVRLGRQVAVKEVTAGGEGPGGRVRALREARAAARLNHPGAVTVHDVIDDGERLYLVMELLDAPTLTALVEDAGPLPPERAAAVGEQLAEVLEAAHGAGIVHRDVKPSNVMVLADGRVKLADFGIARLRGDPGLTASGAVMGSPGFMAPEQLGGAEVGPAADLWGLGATLYYAVEGRLPFTRQTVPAMLAALLSQPPDPPRRAGALGPVLQALLDAEPRRRPAGEPLHGMLRAVATATASRPRTGWGTATVPLPGAAATEEAAAEARDSGAGTEGGPGTAAPGPADPSPAMGVVWADEPGRRRLLLVAAGLAVTILVAVVAVVVVSLVRAADPGGRAIGSSGPGTTSGAPTGATSRSPTGVTTAADAGAASGTAPGTDAGGGPAGSDTGRRRLESSGTAAPGQVLPRFWESATNTVGGYHLGVPGTWEAVADGSTTIVSWPGDATFDIAFEVRAHPAGTDPYRQVRQDAAAFAKAHPASGYRQVRLTPDWTYREGPAAAWEFTWTRNGHLERGLETAFRAGSHTYTVLFREQDLWWLGGGTSQFPPGFEAAFTPLDRT